MLNKIKEFLTSHPNSSLLSAVICSFTALTADEIVALLAAAGLFITTVFGVIQKAVSTYIKCKENKLQKHHDRQIALIKSQDESERYKLETNVILLELEVKRQNLLTEKNNKINES